MLASFEAPRGMIERHSIRADLAPENRNDNAARRNVNLQLGRNSIDDWWLVQLDDDWSKYRSFTPECFLTWIFNRSFTIGRAPAGRQNLGNSTYHDEVGFLNEQLGWDLPDSIIDGWFNEDGGDIRS